MFIPYYVKLEEISSSSRNIRQLKVWSPDYQTSFELKIASRIKKTELRFKLVEQMSRLVQREQFHTREIISDPERKEILADKYGGLWFKVPVEIEIKDRLCAHALPIAAHLFNMVSLICASVMAYFGMILSTTGGLYGQILSIGVMLLGTSVALTIYSFSNVTQDMRRIGGHLDDFCIKNWNKAKEAIAQKKYNAITESTAIQGVVVEPYPEFREEIYADPRSRGCGGIALRYSIGAILTTLIGTNLGATGVILYKTFWTMGEAVQESGGTWLTDPLLRTIAISAVVSATVSGIPFQGGFAYRGTQAISNFILNSSCRARRSSTNFRDGKWDVPVPLSPPSVSALGCPPSADGLGRSVSAVSGDAVSSTHGSTAGRPRHSPPTSGSAPFLMSSRDAFFATQSTKIDWEWDRPVMIDRVEEMVYETVQVEVVTEGNQSNVP